MTLLVRILPALAGTGLLLGTTPLLGQTTWSIDPKASLAWWQVSPNLNHLWATTCPADPEWRPGEGRSGGWHIDPNNPALFLPKTGFSEAEDTVHIPLYPRHKVLSDCAEAVRGHVTVADTVHWTGVHGLVAVRSDGLFTGEAMRDVVMHDAVLQDLQFPEIQFAIDSLAGLTRQGDTLTGHAFGTLRVRNMSQPIVAAVTIFPDSGGLRVLAKWHFPAKTLEKLTPGISEVGLGVSTKIWKTFFMGADLIFRPGTATAEPDTTSAN